MAEEWSTLDGNWHPSASYRSSQLHLNAGKNVSACPKQYFLNSDFETWTREQAIKTGRACKRCLKIAATSTTRHDK